jgi:methylmalonyl-CoA epimerase
LKIKRIIHVGVIVAAMPAAKTLYTAILGLTCTREEEFKNEAKICFLPVGDSQIELIGDLYPHGPIEKMVAEHGEGVHHIAFEVENIEDALAELRLKEVPLRAGSPCAGAHGSKIAFLDPAVTHGVLIELVEPATEG